MIYDVYIYIYRERERDVYTLVLYIYIYIYTHVCADGGVAMGGPKLFSGTFLEMQESNHTKTRQNTMS